MKRITELHGLNIKGHTFGNTLDDFTVFRGYNFIGKTSRLQSLFIALSGQLPGAARTNAGIMSIASGSELAASVVWDDGQKWKRTYIERAGSITGTKDPANLAEIGMPPIFLDAAVFFDSQPKARRMMIVRHCPEVSFNADELVRAIGAIRPDGHDIKTVKATLATAERALDAVLDGDEPVDAIEHAIKIIEESKCEANAAIKRHEGAAQSLTELQATVSLGGRVSADLKALRAKKEEGVERLAELKQTAAQVAELRERIKGMETLKPGAAADAVEAARVAAGFVRGDVTDAELPALIGKLRTDLAVAVSVSITLTAAAQQFDADSHALAKVAGELRLVEVIELKTDTPQAKIEALFATATTRDALEVALSAMWEEHGSAVIAVDRSETAIARNESAIAELTEKFDLIDAEPACPHCGADSKGWREKLLETSYTALKAVKVILKGLKEAAPKIVATRDKIAADMATMAREIALATSAGDEAKKANAANATNADHKARLAALRGTVADAQIRVDAGKESAIKRDANAEQRETLTARIEKLETLKKAFALADSVENNTAEIEGLHNQIDELLKDSSQVDYTTSMAIRKSLNAEIDAQITTKVAEEKQVIAARAQLAAVEKAVEARDRAKAEAATLAAVLAELGLRRDAFIQTTFEALATRANELCFGILPFELTAFQGALGRWAGHKFVEISAHAFSGAELAVSYAAICIALAASSNSAKIAIVDELGRLDPDTKAALALRVRELIDAGRIDQFIGADASPHPFPAAARVKVITLGGKEEA